MQMHGSQDRQMTTLIGNLEIDLASLDNIEKGTEGVVTIGPLHLNFDAQKLSPANGGRR